MQQRPGLGLPLARDGQIRKISPAPTLDGETVVLAACLIQGVVVQLAQALDGLTIIVIKHQTRTLVLGTHYNS